MSRVSTDCAILVPRSLLALPTFSALRISELLNLVKLFSLQMQPTLSHVPQRLLARSFGQTARPKAPPSAYRIPDHAPHSSLKCWKVLDHGPHGFPRIRDRDQNAFPHVLARPNIFSPKYWRDSEAQRFASPHIFYTSWLQEAPLKGLEGAWQRWDLYKKNTVVSNGRQASKAPPPRPVRPQHRPHSKTG